MLFNSLVFFLFAALFFLIWPLVQKHRQPKWLIIIAASLVFYGWWDYKFIFLLIFCGFLNFILALVIGKFPQSKNFFLILSICGNLGILAVFKYLGFIARNLAGLGINISVFQLTLPIGISFYTFQGMSYVIDVYRKSLEPTKNFLHFFAYLSIFPHLIAGPIIRGSYLLPQLAESRKASDTDIWEGFKLIVYGFFKKVVVADNFGLIVDTAFSSRQPQESALYWWAIITFFAIQIYCDFAGYSDIARGLARLMGYDFPVNFNHPYISRSLQEFWTRWHISLSTWFRDYLFFPLLQRRVTIANAHLSMWITMILSGLWHGASWTFVIWGALHAFYFSLEQVTRLPRKLARSKIGRSLSTLLVIFLVWIAWVFFRSSSLKQAVTILSIMMNPAMLGLIKIKGFTNIMGIILILAIISETIVFFRLNEKVKKSRFHGLLEVLFVAFALVMAVYFRGEGKVFVYFQF